MRRSFLYVLGSLVVLACGEATAPERPELGTWRLQTVDGKSLPFTLDEPDVDKYELTGETITLAASGRVTMITSLRVTDAGNVSSESVPDAGTFTVNGSTVTFRFDSDGSTPTATVTGDIMTLGDIGLTFVYRRD
ncbi:MAG TPA: lipocalin family protein [Gemmatimonadaceae bacterium]|nr:lipocalin family protein [Gemmatimonadaceae bacterium]